MKRIILLALMAGLTINGMAQETNGEYDAVVKETRANKQQEIQLKNFTPYGKGAFSNIISNFSLSSALDAGVNGKIELKTNLDNSWLSGGFAVEQKLGKNDKKATFYDFNKGLSNGTKVSFNLQASVWKPKLSTQQDRDKIEQAKKIYAEENKIANYQTVTYRTLETNGSDLIKGMLPKVKVNNPVFVNLDISFSKQKFSFATDSVSLKKIENNHIMPDVSLAVGIPFSVTQYIAFVYSYAEGYEAADELSFTKKFGTTSNLISQDLSFGAPTFKKDHKVSMEYRKTFERENDEDPVFAISPSITYGINSEKIAFSLPVYFIKGVDKDKKPLGLQGGVIMSYLTDQSSWNKFKDGFGAQLILTAPLAMFNGLF